MPLSPVVDEESTEANLSVPETPINQYIDEDWVPVLQDTSPSRR
ncbi:MAG: hypothetical protein U5K54_24110 [Cytophagales bacterium]|nr:hypothetical protein [Cytophagales bacterium]